MIEMHLGGLGFDPKNMSPIVLLRDAEDRNFLPIWIGMFEAAAIAMELQDFKSPRPMTHDLLTKMITVLGGKVKRIIINEIVDNTFYALVEVIQAQAPDTVISIDARPSDAIAIAVRTKVPIIVSEAVMQKAKMVNSEKDEEETQKFKDFIDTINPDDFSKYLDQR
jgi:bifunctional DNase/RNase